MTWWQTEAKGHGYEMSMEEFQRELDRFIPDLNSATYANFQKARVSAQEKAEPPRSPALTAMVFFVLVAFDIARRYWRKAYVNPPWREP